MIAFWLLILAAVGMTAVQDVLPGKALYHDGWYNVINAVFLILAATRLRAVHRNEPRSRAGELLALGGATVVVVAGLVSGLLGPDTHAVIGAPGTTVQDAQSDRSFLFPASNPLSDPREIAVTSQGGFTITAGGAHYNGGIVYWKVPRDVVWVRAADVFGNQLTITQPLNSAFLSPVLLMQQNTTIAGMPVRYDTFAVPAERKTVKAVFFDSAQAARLGKAAAPAGTPAVLFAVADREDRPVPGGIGIVASGSQRIIGRLLLGAQAAVYPGIVVASAPYLPVALAGALLLGAGIVRTAYRS